MTEVESPGAEPEEKPGAAASIEADSLERRFGDKHALDGVSLRVEPGAVHALLGPNGAGKTTLMRVLTGLVDPDRGTVRLMGMSWHGATSREIRRLFGFVPSGDRTFYLRLSGLENLVFFGRLYGLGRREAIARARAVLGSVDLLDASKVAVGVYSHGMQKRLSVARALLLEPPILFVDEATHDLDPEASARARSLVAEAAARGAAVLWATQRVDEIRGFADRVTLLDRGSVRFEGTVPELMGTTGARRFLLHVEHAPDDEAIDRLVDAVGVSGSVLPAGGTRERGDHVLLILQGDAVLGDVIATIARAGVKVLACREERSEIEQAFLRLTGAS